MNGHSIFNLIWDWSRMVDRARQAKRDPEKRQKIIRFGICAVLSALLTVACSSALLLFQFVGNGLVISVICIIFGAAIGVVCTLVSFLTALIQWFCQLSINKRPMTWISFALMLICFALAVVIPLGYLL